MAGTGSNPDSDNFATAAEGNPVTGWGVFRQEPWDFAGLFATREAAEDEQRRAGSDYEVSFGTAYVGSNRFEPSDTGKA